MGTYNNCMKDRVSLKAETRRADDLSRARSGSERKADKGTAERRLTQKTERCDNVRGRGNTTNSAKLTPSGGKKNSEKTLGEEYRKRRSLRTNSRQRAKVTLKIGRQGEMGELTKGEGHAMQKRMGGQKVFEIFL